MTRSIFRMLLTTMALVLLFAGSFNLNRTKADAEIGGDVPVGTIEAPGQSKCMELNGCPGGPIFCGDFKLPDGTYVRCGKE